MWPYRCVTCGTVMAKKQLYYEQKIIEIEQEKKMTEKEKELEKTKLLVFLFPNYCCRGRSTTYIDRVNLIQPSAINL